MLKDAWNQLKRYPILMQQYMLILFGKEGYNLTWTSLRNYLDMNGPLSQAYSLPLSCLACIILTVSNISFERNDSNLNFRNDNIKKNGYKF